MGNSFDMHGQSRYDQVIYYNLLVCKWLDYCPVRRTPTYHSIGTTAIIRLQSGRQNKIHYQLEYAPFAELVVNLSFFRQRIILIVPFAPYHRHRPRKVEQACKMSILGKVFFVVLCLFCHVSIAKSLSQQYCHSPTTKEPIPFCVATKEIYNTTTEATDLFVTFAYQKSLYGGWGAIGIGDSMFGALIFMAYGEESEEDGKTISCSSELSIDVLRYSLTDIYIYFQTLFSALEPASECIKRSVQYLSSYKLICL